MVEFKIAELAQSKGVTGSHKLAQALDVSDRTAVRLWRGSMASISTDMINAICKAFDATPSDFIIYTPDKKKRK